MLDMIFMQVLDMSKTASVVIIFVLVARLLLKKVPRVISYALWAVVLFRLLCPLSIESPISVLPQIAPLSESYTLQDDAISVLGAGEAAYRAIGDALNGGLGMQHIRTTRQNEYGIPAYVTSTWWEVWILFGQYIWLAGIMVMIGYSIISYHKLRKNLIGAVPLRDNIFLSDYITSPFVMGLCRPKIYLPSSLSEKEQSYILLHEQHHIRRFDHILKALAFFALCIHWFNPLVWLAFILSGKDMEMSCDEAVVKKLGDSIRADYSASLLSLATGHRTIAGTPLAFGEGDTKGRIRNLANWRKPAFGIIAVAVIICAGLAVCLLTNPNQHEMTTFSGEHPLYQTLADLDRDGEAETILVTEDGVVHHMYNLYVLDEDDSILWSAEAGTPHVGWNSLFLYSDESGDYLLRYNPTMFQGIASYHYTLFTLEGGEEHIIASRTLDFSANPDYVFTADKREEMLSFADEVNALLEKSFVLLSTEEGSLVIGSEDTASFMEDYAILESSIG